FQREMLPRAVNTHRHEIIHDVVTAGDGIENGADALALFGPRHLLVAEINGVVTRVTIRRFAVRILDHACNTHTTAAQLTACGLRQPAPVRFVRRGGTGSNPPSLSG